MTLHVKWIDRGREPQCPPNPDYPDGIDIIDPSPNKERCSTTLPYPAKRCGIYLIECDKCGQRIGVTTAGRPDDPRSIQIGCVKWETP